MNITLGLEGRKQMGVSELPQTCPQRTHQAGQDVGHCQEEGWRRELLPSRRVAGTEAKSQDTSRRGGQHGPDCPWQQTPHLVRATVMTTVSPDSGTGPRPLPPVLPPKCLRGDTQHLTVLSGHGSGPMKWTYRTGPGPRPSEVARWATLTHAHLSGPSVL